MKHQKYDVLLVDDDMEYAELWKKALESAASVHVRLTEDGEEALQYLKTPPPPDLILLDWEMPKMNGEETLREIRADERSKHIPVLMLCGSNEKQRIMQAYGNGANGYIIKPSSLTELTQAALAVREFWFHVATTPRVYNRTF